MQMKTSRMPINPSSERDRSGGQTARWVKAWGFWLTVGIALLCTLQAGLFLRRCTWDLTDPVRFVGDTHRQCFWALQASGSEGLLNQYDKMAIERRDWITWLDYAPLRLLVMEQWGEYLRRHYPSISDEEPYHAWKRSYEFSAPVLYFNEVMDALAAASAFLLTRYWVKRSRDCLLLTDNRKRIGFWQGSAAALFIWFNPAILLSAYAWPTWDSWIAPMYLMAAFLASTEWWLCSGLVVAVGVMLKGQQLAVAPIFVLWPLVQGRIGASVRWAIGLLLGVAIIVSPWLLTYIPADQLAAARRIQIGLDPQQYPPDLFAISRAFDTPASLWIVGMMFAVTIVPSILKKLIDASNRTTPLLRNKLPTHILLSSVAITLAAAWPCLLARNQHLFPGGLGCSAVLCGVTIFSDRSRKPFLLAALLGTSLFLCIPLFHGSHSWWDCGFAYGAVRWNWIASGLTDNIPGLLHEGFGWASDPNQVAVTLPALPYWSTSFFSAAGSWPATEWNISAKTLFNSIYFTFMVVSGVGIGLQAKRNDRRLLVALVAPWLMFFLLPTEIHGRYLLYAAAVSSICIGESVGMAVLGGVVTLIATIMIADAMLLAGNRPRLGHQLATWFPFLGTGDGVEDLFRAVDATHPGLAWAVILIGAIFLYLALSPTPNLQKGR